MTIIKLWFPSIIMMIACGLLIRQCFKPYFIDPTKVMKSEWIYNNPNRLNKFGKILTLIVIAITLWFFVIPATKDTYYLIKGEYIYSC